MEKQISSQPIYETNKDIKESKAMVITNTNNKINQNIIILIN